MHDRDLETPDPARWERKGTPPVQTARAGKADREDSSRRRPGKSAGAVLDLTPDGAAVDDHPRAGSAAHLRVAVCCITRERPNMLADLLASLAHLRVPGHVSPFLVIIENETEPRCRPQAEKAAALMPGRRTYYANEPRLGIPIARNRAVEVALRHGADLIAFIDDDEVADRDWLAELVARFEETEASLIGGPVQPRLDGPAPSSFPARLVRSGLVARYRRIARKCARRSRTGRVDRITIITNNWLADARLFTEHGLAFDEGLRFTGGSDTKFYRDVRLGRKLPTAWAAKAVVREAMPDERLTYRYQFRRAKEQSKTSIRAKVQRKGRTPEMLSAPFSIAARVLTMSLLLLTIPVRPADNLLRIVRSSGWIAGRVAGLAGSSSDLYRTTTGG